METLSHPKMLYCGQFSTFLSQTETIYDQKCSELHSCRERDTHCQKISTIDSAVLSFLRQKQYTVRNVMSCTLV